MVVATVTSGGLFGSSGDDVLTGIAQAGTGQIHIYAKAGDDTINLDFSSNINRFSHGQHARGDDDGSNIRGDDTFNFINTNNVSSGEVVVGRLEDFDSRDKLYLEGIEIDLDNLPSNVRVVSFGGAHNDTSDTDQDQQWLLITTSTGGHIFYAIEGARVDMDGNGGSNSGNMEKHFIHESDLPNFAALQDVDYRDPQNYVPDGYSAQGGIVINDDDEDAADVLAQINGSANGDLIAAGLNDDTVSAGEGNDVVWGGSGRDTIQGNQGSDTLFGGSGNDDIRGGLGSDLINGGRGADIAKGGNGADTFEFTSGDLMDWDTLSGSVSEKNEQLDLITDFTIGSDVIEFDDYSNVNSMADLKSWKTIIDGNVHYTVQVRATNERVLVDVEDTTT